MRWPPKTTTTQRYIGSEITWPFTLIVKEKNKFQQSQGEVPKRNINTNTNKNFNSNLDGTRRSFNSNKNFNSNREENIDEIVDIQLPSRREIEGIKKKLQNGNEESPESEDEDARQFIPINKNRRKNHNTNINRNDISDNLSNENTKDTRRTLNQNEMALVEEDIDLKEQDPQIRRALHEPVEESSEESR